MSFLCTLSAYFSLAELAYTTSYLVEERYWLLEKDDQAVDGRASALTHQPLCNRALAFSVHVAD